MEVIERKWDRERGREGEWLLKIINLVGIGVRAQRVERGRVEESEGEWRRVQRPSHWPAANSWWKAHQPLIDFCWSDTRSHKEPLASCRPRAPRRPWWMTPGWGWRRRRRRWGAWGTGGCCGVFGACGLLELLLRNCCGNPNPFIIKFINCILSLSPYMYYTVRLTGYLIWVSLIPNSITQKQVG